METDFNSGQTGGPGEELQPRGGPIGDIFKPATRTGLNARYAQIKTASEVEPFAVNQSEGGAFLGNINYAPYGPCN